MGAGRKILRVVAQVRAASFVIFRLPIPILVLSGYVYSASIGRKEQNGFTESLDRIDWPSFLNILVASICGAFYSLVNCYWTYIAFAAVDSLK